MEGLNSSGFHSNGFSLINKLINNQSLSLRKKFGTKTLKEKLIKPTSLYVNAVHKIKNKIDIHGIANITGGGMTRNIPRIIPDGLCANISLNNWEMPEIFLYIQKKSNLNNLEMLKTFNCGIGMIFIVNEKQAVKTVKFLKNENYKSQIIGSISKSKNKNKISYE